MLTFIAALWLVGQAQNLVVRHFSSADKVEVPLDLLKSAVLCGNEMPDECLESFRETGQVLVDVNDDGQNELLIMPGSYFCGTAGCSYYLFAHRGSSWTLLHSDDPDRIWQLPATRFDILPILREGYHDLRIGPDWCVKWNGKEYVDYISDDYRKLPESLFDSQQPEEAEIFWEIQYAGLKSFEVKPLWMPLFPKERRNSVNEELDDPDLSLRWVAFFKGGVWAVRGDKGFLLLPRPAYLGASSLVMDGDWLVIYGDEDPRGGKGPDVARYNRRTHELRLVDVAETKP